LDLFFKENQYHLTNLPLPTPHQPAEPHKYNIVFVPKSTKLKKWIATPSVSFILNYCAIVLLFTQLQRTEKIDNAHN